MSMSWSPGQDSVKQLGVRQQSPKSPKTPPTQPNQPSPPTHHFMGPVGHSRIPPKFVIDSMIVFLQLTIASLYTGFILYRNSVYGNVISNREGIVFSLLILAIPVHIYLFLSTYLPNPRNPPRDTQSGRHPPVSVKFLAASSCLILIGLYELLLIGLIPCFIIYYNSDRAQYGRMYPKFHCSMSAICFALLLNTFAIVHCFFGPEPRISGAFHSGTRTLRFRTIPNERS